MTQARLPGRGTLWRVMHRWESAEGASDATGPGRGNPVDLRIGSRLQHACELSVAQDVEAVGNRGDGTCPVLVAPGRSGRETVGATRRR